jgi:hypothetical protein
MFNKNTENEPKLISAMSNLEYLDAISAPRHDPTRPGKKAMMTRVKSMESEPETGNTENETTEAAEESDILVRSSPEKTKVKGKKKSKAKKSSRIDKDGAASEVETGQGET